MQYLSTSVPTDDYHSAMYTFLSADSIAAICGSEGIQCIEAGYFAFAEADSRYVAVSLKDGKVYSSTAGFEREAVPEAESIKQFIDMSRQRWVDLTEQDSQRRVTK